jgi:transcriptional regulator with XRE-family HTH domain
MKEVGKRIRTRRETLRMTQDELAIKLGYKSRSSVNKIENGVTNLTQSKLKQCADILQTTPSYLMGWTCSPDPKAGLTTQQTQIIIDRFEGATEEVQKAICLLLGIDYASLQR